MTADLTTAQTLTNKTLTSPTINGATIATSTLTSPKVNLGINAQTGTTYTTVLDDNGKLVTQTNASAIATTIPLNSSVAYPIGAQINIAQMGAGQVTISGAGGVTIASTGAKGPQEMGKVMGVISGKLAGKADGKLISTLVKEELAK